MTNIPLVDLAVQHQGLAGELQEAIDRVLRSSHFILGEEVAAFEREFAAFCEVDHAIACGNGTDALEMALAAVGVRRGDEVITVGHTFAATAEAIVRCGAIPKFIDVDPNTLQMDPQLIESEITSRTCAIVPVHLYGSCVDMPAVMDVAARHGLKVVEDAAQAHGARLNGARAGSFGLAACYSFYPGKNLGALGDAGAVTSNDPEIARRVRAARDHGRAGKYEHAVVGRNSRMDALQGAVLRAKLTHLDDWNRQRRAVAARYGVLLQEVGVPVVGALEESEPVHHLYVVRVPHRDRVREQMAQDGVATGVHYPIPLHRQPAFAEFVPGGQRLPVTDVAVGEILSLPMFPELSLPDIESVVDCLQSALSLNDGRG